MKYLPVPRGGAVRAERDGTSKGRCLACRQHPAGGSRGPRPRAPDPRGTVHRLRPVALQATSSGRSEGSGLRPTAPSLTTMKPCLQADWSVLVQESQRHMCPLLPAPPGPGPQHPLPDFKDGGSDTQTDRGVLRGLRVAESTLLYFSPRRGKKTRRRLSKTKIHLITEMGIQLSCFSCESGPIIGP